MNFVQWFVMQIAVNLRGYQRLKRLGKLPISKGRKRLTKVVKMLLGVTKSSYPTNVCMNIWQPFAACKNFPPKRLFLPVVS
ncbi:hypothetical protein HGI47_04510 [Novosphingobium sp. ERN07]|nr:hypothetical protein [Novosphingobium sp. ERN07]